MIRAIAAAAGIGCQIAGLYATVVTFGGWATLGIFAIGALAAFLQYAAFLRSPPW